MVHPVDRVFAAGGIPGLETSDEIASALERLHNVLAELAGLYHGLRVLPSRKAATIVHDYEGVGAWMERRWKTKDAVVTSVIEACRREIADRHLDVAYRHQRGHQSTWAGRDDFARWNGVADDLATRGSL